MTGDAKAVFDSERRCFRALLEETLEARQPITAENVAAIEETLIEAELAAAARALRAAGPSPAGTPDPWFVRQEGTTCVSTSLANAMISLDEPIFLEDGERRVGLFTDDVVANTSGFGKPGDYRSVDDLFKYLESGRLEELILGGAHFSRDYRVRLTASLLDTCEALWSGKGRLIVLRAGHARLAFALDPYPFDPGGPHVRVRDPMTRTGRGFEVMPLSKLRRDFLWSPLKKIPRLMGPHAFPSLSAKELLGHLDRYETMDNLGVDCPSALVFRANEAPPRLSPPPEEGSAASQ